MMVSVRRIDVGDVPALQKISSQTFAVTFTGENSEEDMQKYLKEKLSLEQLTMELQNPKSEFYLLKKIMK